MTLQPRLDLPPLASIHTAWHTPWLITALAQQGLTHYNLGRPTDDAHVVGGNEHAFWMVLADGVGSQPRSRHGSYVATQAMQAYFAQHTAQGQALTTSLMRNAFAAAHAAIYERAAADQHNPEAYAATLSAVLISGNNILAGSLGDSGIVAYSVHDEDDQPKSMISAFCSAPQPHPKTHSIIDPAWEDRLAVRPSQSPHIKALVMATDGAYSFFLKDGEDAHSPYDPYYIDLIPPFVEQATPRKFISFFAQFLFDNEGDNDDDRTLLIAYRPPQSATPPAAQSR